MVGRVHVCVGRVHAVSYEQLQQDFLNQHPRSRGDSAVRLQRDLASGFQRSVESTPAGAYPSSRCEVSLSRYRQHPPRSATDTHTAFMRAFLAHITLYQASLALGVFSLHGCRMVTGRHGFVISPQPRASGHRGHCSHLSRAPPALALCS